MKGEEAGTGAVGFLLTCLGKSGCLRGFYQRFSQKLVYVFPAADVVVLHGLDRMIDSVNDAEIFALYE